MLLNKKIAAFIDVDNCALEYSHYNNVITQLNSFGEIVVGKLYGVSDRKHKEIIAHANAQGYEIALPMRVKKRNAKVFDNRIIVDVIETVLTNDKIDAVAVICAPADLVYFYRDLKKFGVKIIACDNVDEDNTALIDEVVDLGKVEIIKLKKPKIAKAKPIAEASHADVEKHAPAIADVDALIDAVKSSPVSEKEPEPVAPAELKEDESPIESADGESIDYTTQDDKELIRKIEQLRNSNYTNEETDLVNQIRKLLEEMK